MNWYKKASREYHYFGQCDKVRCDQIGEKYWQEMIKKHQKVSQEEFADKCNVEELLEDKPLNEEIMDDPDSYFAKSWWGNKPCYYLMTKGFEFIFLPKGS